ncbi:MULTISPECIES: hypothetical protein [Paenarthrobacter]|uniref:Uncharacterized protein n=1 Tax=Paenarthrobacter ureafaciens TaxID=37931 RepID=A0AAX3EFL5_PAEUR|nr:MULTISPECIES: hypothetical protein [Paenarthrobacter]MDO5865988.1 hypothetical protein [Paenarthrobacter sp. SD-2]MDO5877083.1 hypothetical protein [Paenarthrobacter sp. SD-1]UYV92285.1 hypothetical protein NL395_17450 [Paenarthrobacter ureafaciens]UYV96820.1 hypothetical protein NL394_17480 [Paenarthrobacter ureafaciens]WIV32182.1 hypothetical protein QN084_06115 [Paenarthrobacter sp. R1]
MSNTFELWQKAKQRRDTMAYQIAKAVAAGSAPRQNDIDRFKANEAEMRDLESKFSEES